MAEITAPVGATSPEVLGRLADAILQASINDGATASPLMHEEAMNLATAVAGVEDFYRSCVGTPLMRDVLADLERARTALDFTRQVLRIYHEPDTCRYPSVACTVCEALGVK